MLSTISSSPNSPKNPYIVASSKNNGQGLINRTEIITEVIRLLTQADQNTLFLYGQRQIGKTSLLRALAAHLAKDARYQTVYFDLQGKATLPLAQVLAELAFRLSQTVDTAPPTLWGDEAPHVFKREFLPAILRQLPDQTSLVLFFDEFDAASNLAESQAGLALYPYLQGVLGLNLDQLQIAFAIGRQPEDISNPILAKFKGSELRPIPFLSLEETTQLVHLSETNQSLLWSDEAIKAIQALAGGHPLITKQLCAEVWEQVYRSSPHQLPTVQADMVEQAAPSALRHMTKAMDWLWDGLSPAQRVVATMLAGVAEETVSQATLEKQLKERGVRVIISELQQAPNMLTQWGLFEAHKDGYHFSVELQRRWITEYKPWSLVRDEIDQAQPLAANLFQTAKKHYQAGQFDEAMPEFRKVIRLNPNHQQANLLLAETLLVQGDVEEAHQILESLHQYYPAQARPRLVQALLLQAQAASTEDEQLALYEQILQLEPGEREAQSAYRRIWERRGDTARKAGKLEESLLAYQQASLSAGESKTEIETQEVDIGGQTDSQTSSLHQKTGQVKAELDRRQLTAALRHVATLERTGNYQAAYEAAQRLYQNYPEAKDRLPDLEPLSRKAQIETLYHQALDDIKRRDRLAAQEHLSKIVGLDPSHREATRYLHELARGADLNRLQQHLEMSEWTRPNVRLPLPPPAPQKSGTLNRYQQLLKERWLWIGSGVTLVILIGLCTITLGTSAILSSFTLVAKPSPTATPFIPVVFPVEMPPTFTPSPDLTALSANDKANAEVAGLSAAPTASNTFTPTPTPLPTNTPNPTPTPTFTPNLPVTATFTPMVPATPTPLPSPTPTPAVVRGTNSPIATPATTSAIPGQPSIAIFGDTLEITRYQIQGLPDYPGEEVTIFMDWKLLQATDADFNVSVQFLTEIDGEMLPSYGQKDFELINRQNKRTSGWSVNETLANTKFIIPLSPGATPGEYYLAVVVYDRSSPSTDRLPVQAGLNVTTLGREILLLQTFEVGE
jgi:tetratricopeptide (TPR) repeat protein